MSETQPEGGVLGTRILVVAFEGWNDAGEAASNAVSIIANEDDYEDCFQIDPELYFDYQYTRPTVRLDTQGARELVWPKAVLRRPIDSEETSLLLLSGPEPARSWQRFSDSFLAEARSEGVTGVVTLGAMLSDAPHTRPISVFASSPQEHVREAIGVERPTYEGPVGILTVIGHAAENAGIPTVSLWASVPHYVASSTPSPKASLALLEKLEEIAQVTLARGELPAEAAAWEAWIDAAAADDEDMAEYIRALERARDTWDSPEASGDAIAQAFEHFLRRDDGSDPRSAPSR